MWAERGMPMRPVRVALIDSGVNAAAVGRRSSALTSVRFAAAVPDPGSTNATAGKATPGDLPVRELPPLPDRLGHGTAVARLILAAAPEVALLSAQVFADGRPVAASAVAAAIDWAVAQGAVLINLSLGLREDRWVLRHACASAHAAGVLLVASAPARGSAVYPAAYPGVVAVIGDARCAEGEWSLLEVPAAGRADVGHAQLGACPNTLPWAAGRSAAGGASYAAARICGLAAHWRQTASTAVSVGSWRDQFIAYLAAGAVYRGRERHLSEHAA